MNDEILPGHAGMVKLTCKNHPHLEWHTKNIGRIGCRTIFFDLFNKSDEPECECPLSSLIVHPDQTNPEGLGR